jgi:hypothetical protein
MGRTGSALDNAAAAEAFNSTLEWELLPNNHFQTPEQARHAVVAWIDDYKSQHSTNGMPSPIDYEHAAPSDLTRNRPPNTMRGERREPRSRRLCRRFHHRQAPRSGGGNILVNVIAVNVERHGKRFHPMGG